MISSKILEARKSKGFSQSDLAKMSGVYKSTIHRYEKGVKPLRRNLEKIAAALGLNVDYFYTDTIEPASERASELAEKLKKVREFNASEQRSLEWFLDQILEKRKVIRELNTILESHRL